MNMTTNIQMHCFQVYLPGLFPQTFDQKFPKSIFTPLQKSKEQLKLVFGFGIHPSENQIQKCK